jgi:hypothetical protein
MRDNTYWRSATLSPFRRRRRDPHQGPPASLRSPNPSGASLPSVSGTLRPELTEFIYRFCPSAEIQHLANEQAQDLLATFYGHGLLAAVTTDRYRYEPSSPELARGVAALTKAYSEQRIAVLEVGEAYGPRSCSAFRRGVRHPEGQEAG